MANRQSPLAPCLHQPSPHHIQGLLGGKPANSFAISRKIAFNHIGFAFTRKGVKDQADWFLLGATGWPRDASYSEPKICLTTLTNAFRQSYGHFAAYCTMFGNQLGWHAGKLRF